MNRRCLVCFRFDTPGRPVMPVHQPGEKGRAESGYIPHPFDPGERRVSDRGRSARRMVGNPHRFPLEVEE